MVKKIKEKKVKKVVRPIKIPVVVNDVNEIVSCHVCCQDEPMVKTRLQELQELYSILLKEGITSISKLEVMISQLQK